MIALLRSTFIREEQEARLFFSVKEAEFLKELSCVREAYRYAEERVVEGGDQTGNLRKAAASMCQYGLGALSMKRAAKTAYQGYAVSTELGTFAQSSGGTLQSLDYPDSLPEQSIGDFL